MVFTARYIADGTTLPAGWCSSDYTSLIAGHGGLVLDTDWGEGTNKKITVTITFSHSIGSVRFNIFDIDDSGYGTYNDKVEISAKNNLGNSVSLVNEGKCSKVTVTSNTNSLIYSVPGDQNNGQSCRCVGGNKVRIGADANGCGQIKTITIVYTSATTPTSYDNAPQHIIISNLIANCAPLPIELSSFKGKSVDRTNILSWVTASELNNDYFELERSIDGEEWEKVSRVEGAGSTTDIHTYNYVDKDFEYVTNYYRLKQVDYDGASKESEIIVIDNSVRDKTLVKILNSLGQEVSEEEKGLKFYIYSDGTVVKQMN